MLDLSRGGAFIVTDTRVAVNMPVRLRFQTKTAKYEVPGTIIRTGLLKKTSLRNRAEVRRGQGQGRRLYRDTVRGTYRGDRRDRPQEVMKTQFIPDQRYRRGGPIPGHRLRPQQAVYRYPRQHVRPRYNRETRKIEIIKIIRTPAKTAPYYQQRMAQQKYWPGGRDRRPSRGTAGARERRGLR